MMTPSNNMSRATTMEPTVFPRFTPNFVLPMPRTDVPCPRQVAVALAAASSATTSPTPSSSSIGLGVATRPSKKKERRGAKSGKKVRSSKSNVPGESRYWTPSEHKLFVEALLRYGPKNLKEIAAHVGTRNMIQCRTHEQKCFMRLMREAQKETAKRVDGEASRIKTPKDVYSVSSSCGITLLCVVSEEMSRALQS